VFRFSVWRLGFRLYTHMYIYMNIHIYEFEGSGCLDSAFGV